jgi:hypothetical protein
MKTRSLPFECSIAGRAVGISLRHGGGLQEPGGVYVRCDERDCQYVDLNQAPCPLKIEMFADASDDSVAQHIAHHPGRRFCYACLTELLDVTHEQVRRASWRLKEVRGFAIKPARCVECHRRRVTIGVTPDAAAVLRGHPPLGDAAPVSRLSRGPGGSPLTDHLRANQGLYFCAHCLARALEATPAAMREAMWTLESGGSYAVRTAQCVSCLLTKRAIRYDAPGQEVDGPRRVIDILLKNPGAPFCTSCLAFTSDMAFLEARRIAGYLGPLADFRHETAACSVCGRWQPVLASAPDSAESPELTASLGDRLSGVVRYRGFRIDLLSFRTGEGWRPFALVKSAQGSLVPAEPALLFSVVPSKSEADEIAATQARTWIDKRIP